MQLLLKGGSTGTVTADSVDRDIPITKPVLAAGVTEISGQIYVPSDINGNVNAELIYRWWSTDEATSAGAWQATGQSQTGPGKQFVQAPIASVQGLMIQTGLRIDNGAGTTYARASLQYPIVLVS